MTLPSPLLSNGLGGLWVLGDRVETGGGVSLFLFFLSVVFGSWGIGGGDRKSGPIAIVGHCRTHRFGGDAAGRAEGGGGRRSALSRGSDTGPAGGWVGNSGGTVNTDLRDPPGGCLKNKKVGGGRCLFMGLCCCGTRDSLHGGALHGGARGVLWVDGSRIRERERRTISPTFREMYGMQRWGRRRYGVSRLFVCVCADVSSQA